ncbi:LysR family transcriptional regulator [Alphaproteobacteria bacterium]|nr:LysR family transcriptional regulator [Alphaproteobacteria bacterium]
MESLFSRTTVQFIAAYETLNFRIAAEKCLVTQPAITKSIKKIESDYNMKLFDKKGIKMYPTEFADDLYKELLDMRDTANSLRLKFESWHKGNSGHLNIAVGITLECSEGFVNLISDINTKFPNISLNIASMIKDASIPLLKNGNIDLWIGDISNLVEDEEFIKKFVRKIPLVIYTNKNHKLFKEKKITFSNLENKKWSLLLGGALIKQNSMYKSKTLDSITTQFKKNGIDIEKNLTTFSSPTALFASIKNNGNFAIAAKSLHSIAKNFNLREIDNIKVLDLDVGIVVRNKIADYKIIKFVIDSAIKKLG